MQTTTTIKTNEGAEISVSVVDGKIFVWSHTHEFEGVKDSVNSIDIVIGQALPSVAPKQAAE